MTGEDNGGGKEAESGRNFRMAKIQPKMEARIWKELAEWIWHAYPLGGGSLRAFRRARSFVLQSNWDVWGVWVVLGCLGCLI